MTEQRLDKATLALLEKIESNHLSHLSADVLEVKSLVVEAVKEIRALALEYTETKTNVEWLMKFFWVLVPGIISIIVGLALLYFK